jgi:hypothetical protein
MSSVNQTETDLTRSLQPTRYDRAASLLITTLILIGTSVAVLVFLWLGTRPDLPNRRTVVKPGGTSGEKIASELSELDMPQFSELSQLAIAEPIVELSTLLSRDSITAASTIDIGGPPSESRNPGPPLPPDTLPRWERWEIRYEASNLQGYARQLNFFGIELGAVGRKPLVDYASHFTDASPATRSGSGSDEKRLYLTWRGGRLEAMDRELLANAGVDVAGRTLMQFYPQNVEDTLARIELEHTKDGRVDKLRKTVFGVRRSTDGYEFFVIEQRH